MKQFILAVALTAAGAAPVAQAEKVYHCGNTYSQHPCGADAKVTEIADAPTTASSVRKLRDTATEETKKRSEETCRSAVLGQLKDPDSARFSGIARGIPLERPLPAAGGPLTKTVSYSGYVNAKNSMGGYAGDKLFSCTLDIKEATVLDVRVMN